MYEQRYNRFTNRNQRRQRRQGFLACLRCSALALALLLLAELVVALVASPRFYVTSVRLAGATFLTPQEVAARLRLAPGSNLFRVSTGRLRDRLARHPAVASVTVHRRPPDCLLVRLVERKPAVFVHTAQGIIYLDRKGCAFAGPPRLARSACPLLGTSPPRPGAQPPPGTVAAIRALQALRAVGLRPALLRLDAAGAITAALDQGTEILLGKGEDLREKAAVAALAISRLAPTRGMAYLDLTSAQLPVWKPYSEAALPAPTAR